MNKVFELMNQIDKQDQTAREQREWQNSTEYKLRAIPDEEKKARGICLDKLFAKVYKDAVPLNDEYKVARGEDLDVEIKDFMDARCPEGMEYYVKEAIKKGSVPCKKMYEAVNNLVHSYYAELSKDIENVDPSQLAFQMTDENIKKLDVISDDLNFDEVSAAIGLNVKRTAAAEIARSKDEKERSEQLERELKDDLDVMDEDQIQERLESVNYSDDPIYTPSLFEGIMIGETNKYRAMAESGEFDGAYEYNALSTFGIVKESAYVPTSVVEKAFIESVKEMTKLQLLKTFKMESFDAERTRLMAESYAYESFGRRLEGHSGYDVREKLPYKSSQSGTASPNLKKTAYELLDKMDSKKNANTSDDASKLPKEIGGRNDASKLPKEIGGRKNTGNSYTNESAGANGARKRFFNARADEAEKKLHKLEKDGPSSEKWEDKHKHDEKIKELKSSITSNRQRARYADTKLISGDKADHYVSGGWKDRPVSGGDMMQVQKVREQGHYVKGNKKVTSQSINRGKFAARLSTDPDPDVYGDQFHRNDEKNAKKAELHNRINERYTRNASKK